MKTIRISQEVWEAMVKVGKFGETPDAVLRRVFGITMHEELEPGKPRPLRRLSQQKMSAKIDEGKLIVVFANGRSQSWTLPEVTDKLSIKSMRDQAVAFATDNGATLGQINAVKKALTEAGYHLTK